MKKIFFLVTLLLFVSGLVYNYYPEPKLPGNATIDSLVVEKSKNELLAYSKGKLLKTYKVSFGDAPSGHKEFEGDERTPEGSYSINAKNDKSGYHKNLGVSYPNVKDLAHAKMLGKSAGGDIKVHGIRNGFGFINKFQRLINWTNGCVALTNSEIDELYTSVKIGAKIELKP